MELCLIFAPISACLGSKAKKKLAAKTRYIKTTIILPIIILLKRKVQDRRGPPAVMLGKRAPLPDRRRHRGEDLRRHGPVERNQRHDLALFEPPVITPRVVLVS